MNELQPLTIDHYFQIMFNQNPYAGFDYQKFPLDLQGWGSDHPIFEQVLQNYQPKIIIEVGTWKGASAIHMAKLMRQQQKPCIIFCVDTWLGGIEHLSTYNDVLSLNPYRQHGYPTLYHQFLANIMHEGLQDMIVPFPNTSLIAARWFKRHNIQADLIYIDASHDEDDVYADITNYWPLVSPNGVLLGDDWSEAWYGVICAVNRFAREKELDIKVNNSKWAFLKQDNK